ncbi:MAG: DUF3261 domain-containing protein [Nitrosomonadales bacterium]|nr:MAG: DUF3261 domain-containing protein [Nitrosomonadales bacterium]
MCHCLILLSLIVLSSCAHFANHTRNTDPLLPDTASLPCCWQALEQLEIEFQEKKLSMSSVIAVHNKKLTVVILDPLGRRGFTIIQQGDNIQIEKPAQIQKDFPVKWLLIGIYLRYMPDSGWSFEHSNWGIKRGDNYVLLEQNKREKVILTEAITQQNILKHSPQKNLTSQLEYPDLKLKVNITTLSRNSL